MPFTTEDRARGGNKAAKTKAQQANLTERAALTILRPDCVEADPILETFEIKYVPASQLTPAQVAAWHRFWAKMLPKVRSDVLRLAEQGG